MGIILFILFLSFNLILPAKSNAVYDPLSVPNNKYGIHIIDENDLASAQALVNSSDGDWGYVTLVIPENERKIDKWQAAFMAMKKMHLIPIVRIATSLKEDTWIRPQLNEAENWAEFLNNLPWFTDNRYIVIFNEPNHAKEWGGFIDPQSYADILESYSRSLKLKSADFFILPAGLDASATNSFNTKDEISFLETMIEYKNNVFDNIDGWTSHSYPNPAFSGSVEDRGRGTVTTYEWELDLLKKMGISKDFPVFITETGWIHNAGDAGNKRGPTPEKVSDNILSASRTIWQDERIAAVSPFILNYQTFPFANFSWQKQGSQYFFPQFDAYRSIPKIKGKPRLIADSAPTPVNTKEINGVSAVNTEIKISFAWRVFNWLWSLKFI